MGLQKMIKNSSQLSEKEIQKVIEENFDEIASFYYKLLSEWTNSSYETFQDTISENPNVVCEIQIVMIDEKNKVKDISKILDHPFFKNYMR